MQGNDRFRTLSFWMVTRPISPVNTYHWHSSCLNFFVAHFDLQSVLISCLPGCSQCLRNWMASNNRNCPICRHHIVTQEDYPPLQASDSWPLCTSFVSNTFFSSCFVKVTWTRNPRAVVFASPSVSRGVKCAVYFLCSMLHVAVRCLFSRLWWRLRWMIICDHTEGSCRVCHDWRGCISIYNKGPRGCARGNKVCAFLCALQIQISHQASMYVSFLLL